MNKQYFHKAYKQFLKDLKTDLDYINNVATIRPSYDKRIKLLNNKLKPKELI